MKCYLSVSAVQKGNKLRALHKNNNIFSLVTELTVLIMKALLSNVIFMNDLCDSSTTPCFFKTDLVMNRSN